MPTFTLPYRLSQLQDYTAYLHAMQVGACVVLQEPHRAISVGYNGLPDGRKDESALKCKEYKDYGIYDSSNSLTAKRSGNGHLIIILTRYFPSKHNVECCAESNAIVSAFRYHASLTTSILYTTGQPCSKCAQMIVQSGIKSVVCGGKWIENMNQEDREAVDKIFYWAKIADL